MNVRSDRSRVMSPSSPVSGGRGSAKASLLARSISACRRSPRGFSILSMWNTPKPPFIEYVAVGPGGRRSSWRLRQRLGVLQACPRVDEDHAFPGREAAALQQADGPCQRGGPFGGGKDACLPGQRTHRRRDVLVADSYGRSSGLPDRPEDQETGEGLGDPEAGGNRSCVRPGFGFLGAVIECPHDRGASLGLDGDEAGHRALDPAELEKLAQSE